MFRIYYADDTTYDGDPKDAPGLGVIVIPQDDAAVGRMMMARWDYYCWHPDQRWWGHDFVGMVLCLAKPGWSRVLIGETVSEEKYDAIYARALADPDFAPKSAERVLERPRGLR